VLEADGLRFAAPTVGLEPPDELQDELAAKIAQLSAADESTAVAPQQADSLTTVVQAESDTTLERSIAGKPYRALLLSIGKAGQLVAVGAVALVQAELPLAAVGFELLEEVARALLDAPSTRVVHAATPVPRE
jgi:hypothetical protein